MHPKLIFIGLDGLGLDMARDLVRAGVMPHLGAMLDQGASWGLNSPLPEMSPVCWTSIFTGLEPGGHGVFGFGQHRPGTYQVRPVDSTDVRAPRLWDRLTQEGRPSVVLNVPLTYPPTPIEGVMVAGFVCPDLAKGVHPPSLLPRVEGLGYRTEADMDLGREKPGELAADLARVLERRLALFRELWADPWDLFCAVITDTDRVNHFLWPALWDQSHPLCGPAREIYRQADQFLGWVWEQCQGEVEAGRAALVVAADHSFGPIEQEVYLNPWLREKGWLLVAGAPGAEAILPGTRALALDPGRIHLHWRGRFPNGHLAPGPAADALLDQIAAGLLAITDSAGRQAVARVHRGRELYSGPHAGEGPDLVAQAAPGFSLRAGLGMKTVMGRSHLTGVHLPAGALALWRGPGAEAASPSHIKHLHGMMSDWLGLAL